jgi:hypothetical protein
MRLRLPQSAAAARILAGVAAEAQAVSLPIASRPSSWTCDARARPGAARGARRSE